MSVTHSDGDEAGQVVAETGVDAAPYRLAEHVSADAADHGTAPRSEAHGQAIALTAREREVVCLIADGKSNKIVAHLLGISPKTVESHRGAAMRKFNVHSTAQLVRCAIRCRLVSP